MPYEDLSIQIAPASWNRIQNALTTLKQELHFLINLTPAERGEIMKMGDGTLAFVKKVSDYIKTNPEYLPGFVDKDEFEKDFTLSNQMDQIFQVMSQLQEGVEHTRMAVGAEALQVALMYYNNVGLAANQNQAGAGAIHKELGQRFVKQGQRKNPTVEDSASEETPL